MVSISFNIGLVIQGSEEMTSGLQIKLEWTSMGVSWIKMNMDYIDMRLYWDWQRIVFHVHEFY